MKKYTRKLKSRKGKSKKVRTQSKRGGGWWPWSTTTESQTPLTRQNGSRNLLANAAKSAQNAQSKANEEQRKKNASNAFAYQSGQNPNEKVGPY